MNFNFEGNYKPRRNINLGGIKRVEDKKSLMLKAQAERKARELERRKLKSAQQIQAFYRGRKEAFLVRQETKNEFERQLSLNNDNVLTLTRQLLLFYTAYTDNELLDRYNTLLLGPRLESMFQIQDQEQLDSWIWQTCLLIKKVLLPSMETSLVSSGHILFRLFDPSTYPKSNQEIRVRIMTFAIYQTTLFTSVKNTIMSHTTLKTEMEYILLQLASFNPPYYYSTSALIQQYQKRPQSVYVTRDVILQKLVLEVFTEPFLLDTLAHSVTTKLVVELPFKCLLNNIIQLLTQQQHELKNYAITGLLMNVTELGDIENGKYLNSALTVYAETIQMLLSRLPVSYLTGPKEQEELDMRDSEDDESSEDEANLEQDVVMKEVTPVETIPPIIRERLESLYNSARVNQLLYRCIQLATTENDAIQSISGFFNTIMLRWPMKKDAILNTLLYRSQKSRELMQILWNAWAQSSTSALFNGDHIMPHLSEAVTCITQNGDSWSVLYLLCEVYGRLLLTIGDEEFLDKQNTHSNPLDLQQVIVLSQQLKNISFVMFWRANSIDLTGTIGLTGIQLSQLRTSVTYLLQQIHMRDSRRHFCPANHWLIPDLKTDTFSTEAVAEEFNLESQEEEQVHQSQRRRPMRTVSKGRLAVISPRLGLLNNIPFVIPFEQRVEIFRMFIQNDKKRNNQLDDFFGRSKLGITVRRDHIFEDGFNSLHSLGAELKNKIAISFVDEFGLEEAGIDGGGVFKEFLTGLSKEAFDKNYGLFTTTPEQLLYPNPTLQATEPEQLEHFQFLGLIIGKAVYEGILLDVAFAEFFLKKCLGQVNYLDDLSSLDPDLYKGLLALKDLEGNIEDLSLDFTSTHMENGRSITVDLIPQGSNVPVTNQNRIQYIYSMANYRLNTQIAKQCRAFFRGLSTIIDIKWLRMFNQQELQILLGGASVPIDLNDLRQHTVLAGYMDHDPTVKNFWKVMESFDNDLRMKFVKFVTSCSRPPLLGFKELVPQFCLRNAGADDERLPTSSTCVNLLKLPNYSSYRILKEKLLYAITADAGFDLS